MTGVASPSKYLTIPQFQSLKDEGWVGKGKEYSAEEGERLLWQKRQRRAELEPLDFDGPDFSAAIHVRTVVMPPYPVSAWHRILTMPLHSEVI